MGIKPELFLLANRWVSESIEEERYNLYASSWYIMNTLRTTLPVT